MTTTDERFEDLAGEVLQFWSRMKQQLKCSHRYHATGLWQPDIKEFKEVYKSLELLLPTLTTHLEGTALAKLKQANPWVAMLELGSQPDWGTPKSIFLDHGPKCLEVLSKLTELNRVEGIFDCMIDRDDSVYMLLLLHLRNRLDRESELETSGPTEKKMEQWADSLSRNVLNNMLDTNDTEAIMRTRIKVMFKNRSRTQQTTCKYNYMVWIAEFVDHFINELRLSCNVPLYLGSSEKIELWQYNPCERLGAFIFELYRRINNGNSSYWNDYKNKVRSFVHEVGCAKVHDEPEENIAELRLFHSVTIGYFAKLQDQYVKKELEAKRLRHYITALEFRYLLENLTPPCQPGTPWSDPNCGPRWMKFWEEALKDEYDKSPEHSEWALNHPLKGILDARNPTRGTVNQGTGARTIHKMGQKGQMYRAGSELYGTLSDEIHHFRGKEFTIEDGDGWTKLVTDILRALKPREDNIDEITGEINWDAERDRYLFLKPETLALLAELPFGLGDT